MDRPQRPGVRAAPGDEVARGDRGHHRRGRRRRCSPTTRPRPSSRALIKLVMDWGVTRPRGLLPPLHARDGRGDGGASPASLACSPPAAATTTATRARTLTRCDDVRAAAEWRAPARRDRRRARHRAARRLATNRRWPRACCRFSTPDRRASRAAAGQRGAGRVHDRRRHAAELPRLDAGLPDEPFRLRGDGRRAACRGLRRGAQPRVGRPDRHQLVRHPRGGRAEGHRPDGPPRPPARLRIQRCVSCSPAVPCAPTTPHVLHKRYPQVDLFLRPDEEPELTARLGLAGATSPGRMAAPTWRSSAHLRLAADHLRLRQDVHVLHRAFLARAGAQPAVRRRGRRGALAGRGWLSGSDAARPERQLLRPRPVGRGSLRAHPPRPRHWAATRARRPPGHRRAAARDRWHAHRGRRPGHLHACASSRRTRGTCRIG